VYVSGLSSLEQQLDKVLSEVAGSAETWLMKKGQLIEQKRWATLFYS